MMTYIINNGKYIGLVSVYLLLNAITEISITLARDVNPLTGLPGNKAIQREIVRRMKTNKDFDVMYIDINNFKPYNDHYGFERGDYVIKKLSEIIQQSVENYIRHCSIGHIGEDDLILLTPSDLSIELFQQYLKNFQDQRDNTDGYFLSKNRKGEYETFYLLSFSIAIVTEENNKIVPCEKLA